MRLSGPTEGMTSSKFLQVGRVHLQAAPGLLSCSPCSVCRDPSTGKMLLAKTGPPSTAQGPSLCHSCPNPCPQVPVGACPPLKDPDSQGKRKMPFKTSLCCVLFVCNCSAMQCPSLACAQTRVRHTRTLLSSSTAQTASCNLSHTVNTADAALQSLNLVRPACMCIWSPTVPIYVQEGRLWACTNAHPCVHGQEDQGTHVSMDGDAVCLHACVPVCGTGRRQGCGHCYCPVGEKHFRMCLRDGGSC